jgi:hypothetical protein
MVELEKVSPITRYLVVAGVANPRVGQRGLQGISRCFSDATSRDR